MKKSLIALFATLLVAASFNVFASSEKVAPAVAPAKAEAVADDKMDKKDEKEKMSATTVTK